MKNIFSNCLLLLLFFLMSSCIYTSAVKIVEMSEISGTIKGISRDLLSDDTSLHVQLLATGNKDNAQNVVASQSLAVSRGDGEMPYSLKFAKEGILDNYQYAIQACMTVKGKLQMISLPVSGLAPTSNEHIDLILQEVQGRKKDLDFSLWIDQGETALQNSVQANLAGICRDSVDNYDTIENLKTSKILSPEWLSGPRHKVREETGLRGPHFLFVVDSDYGTFSAQGTAMLRRLVREIYAIESLQKIKGTEAFKNAFSETALAPFGEFKKFILHPIDRLGGTVKGMMTFMQSSSAALTQKRSEYEDRYLEALVSVSKFKRRYAAQLDIDAYTSNPKVQEEINSVCWAAALGDWAPVAALYPFTGPAKLAYSTFSWVETLNRLVTEEAPDSLRFRNNKILGDMLVPAELRNKFLSHPKYSPRHQTIIVGTLNLMEEVQGREKFIEQAVAAKSEVDALTFQQLAELLLYYHQADNPIAEIQIHKGIPIGISKKKDLVMILPLDIGRWTPFAEDVFSSLSARSTGGASAVYRKIVMITGQATEKFSLNMDRFDIDLREGVERKFNMMD